jgi:hypothetical protein
MNSDKCCKCGGSLGSYSQLMLGKDNSINRYKRDFWCCQNCYTIFEELKNKQLKNYKYPTFQTYGEFWVHVFFDIFFKHDEKVKVMLV